LAAKNAETQCNRNFGLTRIALKIVCLVATAPLAAAEETSLNAPLSGHEATDAEDSENQVVFK
jgi:hypothetical protein